MSHRYARILAAIVLSFCSTCLFAQVNLTPTPSPSSGGPGVTNVVVTGSGFPSGTISPAQVTVRLAPGIGAPAGSPLATIPATSVATVIGSTRRVGFQIPSTLLVSSPAPYQVTISGVTGAGGSFASINAANLTVNPPPAIQSVSPNSAPAGQNSTVTINTLYTNFVQGITQANFGPGISVGGGPSGGFGPVTVTGTTAAVASLTIDPSATVGVRDVSVRTGAEQATKTATFTVTAAGGNPTSFTITLTSPSSPSAGSPGNTIQVTGSGFPSDGINPGAVSVLLQPATAAAGPTIFTPATAISTGATRTVTFTIPNTISLLNSTPYLISLTGSSVGGSPFSSGNYASLTILGTTACGPPLAKAGNNQTVNVGTIVTLDGSGSSDPCSRTFTYAWSLVQAPAGSTASLLNPTTVTPKFTADRPGNFVAQLIVNNGVQDSAPSTVTISTQVVPPTANAGPNQKVDPQTLVTLDGTGSSDPNGLLLTYAWSLASRPPGATAVLANPTSPKPTFTVDKAGDYVAQLVVNNGFFSSTPSQVTITTNAIPPVANAGPNQTVNFGATVTLDGSKSTDANGNSFTYAWSLGSAPPGSNAALTNPTSVNPTFVADRVGTFVFQLIVNDGFFSSSPATVSISTEPVAPVANAGPNQTVNVGNTVILDGSGSTDANGLQISYAWSLVGRPSDSNAALVNPQSVSPTFVADRVGTYVAQLFVNNGTLTSQPSTVTITTNDVAPTANAGPAQLVNIGTTVQLDGSGSSDLNGRSLTYKWLALSKPPGSNATLSDPTAVRPTFTDDLGGNYVFQLVVNDGFLDSLPSTVNISTNNIPPTAKPGANQLVNVGATVTLDGSASTDANGYTLTYAWSLISKPTGSNASLSGANTFAPVFTVDRAGDYIAQLIVSDPLLSSQPATVKISTINIPPVANFTTNVVSPFTIDSSTGFTTVQVDGSTSTGTSGYPLSYAWSIISKPAGSNASLSSNNTTSPVSSFNADQAGDYVVQLIVNDSIQNSSPTSRTVTGQFSCSLTVDFVGVTGSLLTYQQVQGNVHINGGLGCTANRAVTVNLSQSNTLVGTITNNKADVAKDTVQVIVNQGALEGTFWLTTNSNTGTSVISAFATDFQSVTTPYAVNSRSLSLVPAVRTVIAGATIVPEETVALNQTAFGPGNCDPTAPICTPIPVDLNLVIASNAGNVIGPAQQSVTIPGGSTSTPFSLTAVSAGSATLTATPARAGYSTASAQITVLPSSLAGACSLSLPLNYVLGPGQTLPFPISIGSPAGPGGVTVNLVASAPGLLGFSPASAVIPEGLTAPTTPVLATGGNGTGSVVVTGTPTGGASSQCAGFIGDSQTVSVNLTMTFVPSQQTIFLPTPGSADLQLNLSSPAPAGFTIDLTTNPSIATVASPIAVTPGASTVLITVNGVTAGTTTLTASVDPTASPSYTAILAAIDPISVVFGVPAGISNCCAPATVGKDLQQGGYYVNLGQPAPAGNLSIVLTSSDSSKLRLSPNATIPGAATCGASQTTSCITVNAAAGSTISDTFFVQGLDSSGTVTVTASSAFGTSTRDFTLVPSGFALNVSPSLTNISSGPSTVSVTSWALTPGLNFLSQMPLRAGITPVTVSLGNSLPSVGTLGSPTVTLSGATGSQSTTWTPQAVGTSAVSISSTPAGFSTPTSSQSVNVTVNNRANTSITNCCSSLLVGRNMQLGNFVGNLGVAAPVGGVDVTFTSTDSTKLLLANAASAPGAPSITFHILGGGSQTPAFFVQGLASGGTSSVTMHAVPSDPMQQQGYNDSSASLSLYSSGFVIGGGTTTTTFSGPGSVFVSLVPLNPTTLTTVSGTGMTLSPGVGPVTVNLQNCSNTIGTLGPPTTLTFNTGDSAHTTTWQPTTNGGTCVINLAPPPPSGFALPQPASSQSTTFTVVAPNSSIINISPSVPFGVAKDMQLGGFAGSLGAAAPAGGASVTITSADSNKLLLSKDGISVGSGSLTFNLNAGQSQTPSFFAQAIGDSGTVMLTLTTTTSTSSNYNSSTAMMTLFPSGFVISGGGTTTVSSGPSSVGVSVVPLNPTTLNPATGLGPMVLRPGIGVTSVNLQTDPCGTLATSTLLFNAGDASKSTTWQPVSGGTCIVSLVNPPPGTFTQPSSSQSIAFTVTAPSTSITGPSLLTIGQNSESSGFVGHLGVGAPAAGVTVTISSSDPNRLLLSTNALAVGTGTLTFNLTSGQSATSPFLVQAIGGSGTVSLNLTAPGYTGSSLGLALSPTGFVVGGGTTTTTLSGPSTILVSLDLLDPVNLNAVVSGLTLRPGAGTPTVNLSNCPGGVGALGATALTFTTGSSSQSTTWQPAGIVGTCTVSIVPPPSAGFSQPSNGQSTTFTVNLPGSSISLNPGSPAFVGKDMQSGGLVASVGIPVPPSGVFVQSCGDQTQFQAGVCFSITSPDPQKLLLSKDTVSPGAATISFLLKPGQSQTPQFNVQALAGSGNVTLTGTLSAVTSGLVPVPNGGYSAPTSLTMSLVPSGFSIGGGGTTTTLSAPSNVSVCLNPLNSTSFVPLGGFGMSLRPGAGPVAVDLQNSNGAVGALTSGTLTFNTGNTCESTTWQPLALGTSTVAIVGVDAPSTGPFSVPQPSNTQSILFTVVQPGIFLRSASAPISSTVIGQDLQAGGYSVSLAQPAPVDTQVTISAPVDPISMTCPVAFSADGASAGSCSLTRTVLQGQLSTPTFFIQAMPQSSNVLPLPVTVNLSASGSTFGQNTALVNVYPSGFAFQQGNFTTTTLSSATTVTVVPAALDPLLSNVFQVQQLRFGSGAIPVLVTFDNPSIGSVQPPCATAGVNPPCATVIFNGDDNPNFKITSFQPAADLQGKTSDTGVLRLMVCSDMLCGSQSTAFSSSSSQIAVTVNEGQPLPGLVSWWPGNGNFNDIQGTNQPSLFSGVTFVAGQVGSAFDFGPGANYFIDIQASPSLANPAFTWAAWVRPDGPGPNNDALGNVIVAQNIGDANNTSQQLGLFWRASDNRFQFSFGNTNTQSILSNNSFPPGQFYFVAGAYDGATFKLYVNGQLESSLAGTFNNVALPWSIGSLGPALRTANLAHTWNGVLDEVQAYSRALSQAELQALTTAGASGGGGNGGGGGGGGGGSSIASITPATAHQGDVGLPVIINGSNTHFGATTVTFCPGISITGIVVNSATSLTATINVAPDAPLGACSVTVATGGEIVKSLTGFSILPGIPALTQVSPSSAAQATANLDVAVTGAFTHFVQGTTTASFGTGVTINSVTVNSSTSATVNITVQPTTTLGFRSVTMTTGAESVTLQNGFSITAGNALISNASPSSANQGQSALTVTITGMGTHFDATSGIAFCSGVTVTNKSINSPTSIQATINVNANANVGPCVVTVTTGGEVATGANVFSIVGVPAITLVNPSTAPQGTTLDVAVTSKFTNFLEGTTTANFGAGVTINGVTVNSSTSATVNVTVQPTTTLGSRTVTMTTGTEVVTLLNGFSVTAGNATLSSASPNSGTQGQLGLAVTINGTGTHFDNTSIVSFCPNVSLVGPVVVNNPTSILATINIGANAAVGSCGVTVTTGGEVAANPLLFSVTAGIPVITLITPNSASQGDNNITVNVTGSFTHFNSGTTTASFGSGITINTLNVISLTSASVNISVDPAAATGARDVTFTTGIEIVKSVGGFTVNPAAVPSGTVGGHVTNPDNSSAPGVTVTAVSNISTPGPLTAVTDANGNYVINGVPVGSFRVTVSNAGSTNGCARLGYIASAGQSVTVDLPMSQCSAPPAGLIGWWPADGNANDIIGGDDGTLHGTVTFGQGAVGSGSFQLNGSSYIQVPDTASLEPAQVSVSAWVKSPLLPGSFKYILDKGNPSNASYALYTGGSGGLFFYITTTTGVMLSPDAGTGLWNGAFHHVVGTYDGSTVRLYVDGSQIGSGTPASPPIRYAANNPDLFIGSFEGQSSFDFTGNIDEVQVFNRALTGTEVASIFAAGSNGECKACLAPPTGLVSWYSGDKNTDDLLGANNPTASNAVSFVPGKVNAGMSFGSGGFVDIPPSASLANQSFTLSAWVRPDGPGPNNDGFGSHIVGQDWSSNSGLKLLWRAIDNHFVFIFGNISSELIVSTDAFAPGQFYLVEGTYDGSAFKLYVNGNLEGQFASTKTIAYSSIPWTIGSTSSTFRSIVPRTWNGVIDEVQVLNRALTISEVQAIYSAGSSGECKPAASTPIITNITPTSAQQGQTLNVTVNGNFTNFVQATTTANFGTGVTINSVTVNSNTTAVVNITIQPTATTGSRTVTLTTSSEVVTLAAGFNVAIDGEVISGLVPNSGNQNQQGLQVAITGTNTHFDGTSTATFGSGITVTQFSVTNSTSATATINIDPATAIGTRTVTVTTGGEIASITNGFTVNKGIAVITGIAPVSAHQGDSNVNVTVTGQYTSFVQGTTTANFGTGITVNSVTVNSATSAVVNISVSASAPTGLHDVTLTTGAEAATKSGSFTVLAGSALVQSVSPNSGAQNSTATVTITGGFTNFQQGLSAVAFGGASDITVNSVTVTGPTQLQAAITVQPGATLGLRSITVTTGSEVATTPAGVGFTVQPGTAAIVSLSPNFGGPGSTNLQVTITTQGLNLLDWTLQANFGAGISVNGSAEGAFGTIQVTGPTTAVATLTINAAATIGNRDVTVNGQSATGGIGMPATFHVQTTNTWISPNSGQWTTAANWSKGTIPAASDVVIINTPNITVTVSSGTNSFYSLTTAANSTLVLSGGSLVTAGASQLSGPLTISGGTLDGAGTWNLASLNWTGGTIQGSGGLQISSPIVLGNANLSLVQRTLTNPGTLTFSGITQLSMFSGATLVNPAGSTIDIRNDNLPNNQCVLTYTGGTAVTLTNMGILKKSAGTGSSCLSNTMVFNQQGTVEVDSGTLAITTLATNTGTYTLGAAGTLNPYNGATFNVSQFTGPGTLSLASTNTLNGDWTTFPGITVLGTSGTTFNGNTSFPGTLPIAGAVTFNGASNTLGTVNLTGTMNGNGPITITQLNWTGGTIGGTGALQITQPIVLGNANLTLNQRQLTNPGTMTFIGNTQLSMVSGATLVNPLGSTIDIRNDALSNNQCVLTYTGGIAVTLTNMGMLKKSAGTGSSCLSNNMVFNQQGTVEVDTGTLAITTLATNTGTYTLGAAGTLNPYNGATFNVSQFTGTGTLSLAATNTLNGDWTTFPGITVLGTSGTTFNGNTSFPGTLPIAGAVTFNGASNTLGTVNLTGTMNGSGPITITQLNWTSGTIGGTGALQITQPIVLGNNVLTLTQRTLTNPGTMTFAGNTQLDLANGAVLNNPVGSTIDIRNDGLPTNQCVITWTGGSVTVNNAGVLKKSAGTGSSCISTTGTIFTNTGSIDVESGTLNLPTYSEAATSTLTIKIGGTTPGTQFGRLVVGGAASFAGTLNVVLAPGYTPNIGDTFNIVQFGSKTGTFSATNGFTIGGGEQFSLVQNPTNMTLAVVTGP
jgi:hypothetical protein